MAMALVGTFTAAEGSGGTLTTGSRTTTAGNMVTGHATAYANSTAPDPISISDNKGNTYTQITQINQNNGSDNTGLRTGYNANGTRGTSHTVSSSNGANLSATLVAHEWSGIEAAPTVVSNAANGTGTAVSVSVTAGAASGFIGTMAYLGFGTTFTETGGASLGAEVDENSDFQAMGTAYKTGLTGAQSIAWTLAASRVWIATVSAFTESAGGGTVNTKVTTDTLVTADAIVKTVTPYVAPTSTGLIARITRRIPG